jgi:hypothetical protein
MKDREEGTHAVLRNTCWCFQVRVCNGCAELHNNNSKTMYSDLKSSVCHLVPPTLWRTNFGYFFIFEMDV